MKILGETNKTSAVSSDEEHRTAIEHIASDIRYLKPDKQTLTSDVSGVHAPWYVIVLYSLPTLILVSSAALKKRHDLRTRDSALIRRNGALKNTRKLLDTASELLDRGDIRGCYGAIHGGILSFVGDSLDQPPGTVNSFSLSDILRTNGVGGNLIERAVGIIDRCERAEYSPDGLRAADHRQAIQDAGALIEELKKNFNNGES